MTKVNRKHRSLMRIDIWWWWAKKVGWRWLPLLGGAITWCGKLRFVGDGGVCEVQLGLVGGDGPGAEVPWVFLGCLLTTWTFSSCSLSVKPSSTLIGRYSSSLSDDPSSADDRSLPPIWCCFWRVSSCSFRCCYFASLFFFSSSLFLFLASRSCSFLFFSIASWSMLSISQACFFWLVFFAFLRFFSPWSWQSWLACLFFFWFIIFIKFS